jgi:hypothetical protein
MLRRRKRSNPVAVPKPAWWAVCCDSGWKPSRNIQKPQWWAWPQIFSWISSYPQGWLKSWIRVHWEVMHLGLLSFQSRDRLLNLPGILHVWEASSL